MSLYPSLTVIGALHVHQFPRKYTHCNTRCNKICKTHALQLTLQRNIRTNNCSRASPSSAALCMSFNLLSSTHCNSHCNTHSNNHRNTHGNTTYEHLPVAVPRRHQRHFACPSICSRARSPGTRSQKSAQHHICHQISYFIKLPKVSATDISYIAN